MEVDAANNSLVPLAPGSNLPPINRPSGITFDTKRRRLLVQAQYLYAYDPASGQWSAMELEGQAVRRPAVIAYHPQHDAVFTLGQSWDLNDAGALVLSRWDDKGALVEKVRLSEPLSPAIVRPNVISAGAGGRAGERAEGPVQLIAAGDSLVVLASYPNLETYIFRVEPKTGQAQLTWRSGR